MSGKLANVVWFATTVVAVTALGNLGSATGQTRTKAKAPAVWKDAPASELATKIATLSDVTQLDEAFVAHTLGTKLGTEPSSGERKLVPTALIEAATVRRFPNGKLLVVITPKPSLAFALEHLEHRLLDRPVAIRPRRVHWGPDDSLGIRISSTGYAFRVPAGELILEETSPVPPDTKNQLALALGAGYDAVTGKPSRRVLIKEVVLREEVSPTDWKAAPTLLERRKRK